ncbi:MAG: hypothetical protein LW701_02370 [Fluviicola sp.]|nr:hypothetical protein [Fluviicola sp.]
MEHTKFRSILVSIVFLALIAFPIINGNLKFVKDIANNENRKLADRPSLTIKDIEKFPMKYESYYNDNFTVRSILVKYYALNNIKIFKKSPIPESVVIGVDGWMFLAGREYESYLGQNNLKPWEMKAISEELEYRKEYLAKRGCKFYFMVAPAKTSIYPEKVSNNEQRKFNSWGEQLVKYLDKNCQVKPINVYDVLRKNKSKELLYFKLDNHWNNLGGFYASNEVLARMKEEDTSIYLNNINDYTIKRENRSIGNIVNMFPNVEDFKDFYVKPYPKKGYKASEAAKKGYPVPPMFEAYKYENSREIVGSKKKKLMIVSDSFGGYMFPFMAETFSRTIKIFDKWEYKLNEKIVEQEKPDVMLLICLESNLRSIIRHRSSSH